MTEFYIRYSTDCVYFTLTRCDDVRDALALFDELKSASRLDNFPLYASVQIVLQ